MYQTAEVEAMLDEAEDEARRQPHYQQKQRRQKHLFYRRAPRACSSTCIENCVFLES